MTRIFWMLVVLVAAAPLVGVAAADTTATATANNTTTTANASAPVQKAIQIDPVTTISDWRVEGGEFHVVIKSEVPTSVKVTDAGAMYAEMKGGDGARAAQIPTRGYQLDRGKTEITFSAETVDGAAAITVASPRGAVLLRSDAIETGGGPPVPRDLAQGLILSAVAGTAVATVWAVRRKQQSEDERGVERHV